MLNLLLNYASFRVMIMITIVLSSLQSCDPDPTKRTSTDSQAGVEESFTPRLGQTPLSLIASEACMIDSDCEMGKYCFIGVCAHQCEQNDDCSTGLCDLRGKCQQEINLRVARGALTQKQLGAVGSSLDTLNGVSLVSNPPVLHFIAPGQTELKIQVQTNLPVLDLGGLAYRVDSSVSGVDQDLVRKSMGEVIHEIKLLTGRANPSHSEGARSEFAYVTTSVGGFEVRMVPLRALDGHYKAKVNIGSYQTSLPFYFDLQTTPAGTTFETANSVSLIIDRRAYDLFGFSTPADLNSNELSGLKVPLNYDPIEDRWVALIKAPYNFPNGAIFSELPSNQVRRSLRITFEIDEQGQLIGSLNDTWQGLLNAYTANDDDSGLSEALKAVSISGDFITTRLSGLPSGFMPLPLAADASNPMVISYPPSNQDPCPSNLSTLFNDPNIASECSDLNSVELQNCANKLSEQVLNEQNLDSLLSNLFEGDQNNEETFEGFLENCAQGQEPSCLPSPALQCALRLTGLSLKTAVPSDQTTLDLLWSHFTQLQLQQIGGDQLSAFYYDVVTRLDYLGRGQYEVPSIAEETLAQLNETALLNWDQNVVEKRLSILRRSMSPEVFLFLGSPRTSEIAEEEHTRILIALVTAWVDAADTLALAARRWNDLHRLDRERRDKAQRIASRLRELYISAIVIVDYHKAAGRAAEAAPIASSLNTLIKSYETLNLPFSELLSSRDTEVVLSTSVDESHPINAVLTDRQMYAEEIIEEATNNIEQILDDLFSTQLYLERRRTELANAIGNSHGRLAELCGIPKGCTPSDVGSDDECDSSWEPGLCGFIVDKGPHINRIAQMIQKGTAHHTAYTSAIQTQENCLQTQLTQLNSIDTSSCDHFLAMNNAQEQNNSNGTSMNENLPYQMCLQNIYASLMLDKESCAPQILMTPNWRFSPDTTTASEAGSAIFDVIKADLAYDSIKAEHDQYRRGVILKQKQIESFVKHLINRKDKREIELNAFKERIQAQAISSQNIADRRREQIVCLIGWENSMPPNTECLCGSNTPCPSKGRLWWWQNQRSMNLNTWQFARSNYINNQINFLDEMTEYRIESQALRDTEYVLTTTFEEIRDGFPTGVDDAGAIPRAAIGLIGGVIRTTLIGTASGLEANANRKEYAAQQQELMRELYVDNLMDNQEHQDLIFDAQNEIQDLQGELAVIENDIIRATMEAQIDLLIFQSEQVEEEAEDILELEERRADLLLSFGEEVQYDLALIEAETDVRHAILKYDQITTSAGLEHSTLEALIAQKKAFEQLASGPQAFLTMSSKLEQAERQLTYAKEGLLEWLSALEFFAVRPFLSERLSVQLAQSSYELRAISERFKELSNRCGGVTNTQKVTLSLKRDLLNLKDDVIDDVTKLTLTPKDRLQEILTRKVIPIDQRVRYQPGSNLGTLIQSNSALSASFTLKISNLANLPVSCNAKLKQISMKLIGEGFDDSLPVVTILYDGISQLNSCQPNLGEYVNEFGQGATRYNTVTSFEVTGRSASFVAGVGEQGSVNESFNGLPIASRYTLLIDTSLPANQNLPWTNLSDIELEVSYGYQDLFPSDSACN